MLARTAGGGSSHATTSSPRSSCTSPCTYAFFACGIVANIFLVYFAVRLARVGEQAHAFGIMLVNVSFVIMALLEGIIAIPGDETNLILNFFFLAGWVWALGFAEIYFAYQALARHLARPVSPPPPPVAASSQ